MRIAGVVLVLLAVVGTLSSWSALQKFDDESWKYLAGNVVLLVVGVSLLLVKWVKTRRIHKVGASSPDLEVRG